MTREAPGSDPAEDSQHASDNINPTDTTERRIAKPPEQPHHRSPESEADPAETPATGPSERSTQAVDGILQDRTIEPGDLLETLNQWEVRHILEEETRTWGPEQSKTREDLVAAVAGDMRRFNFSGAVELLRAAGFVVLPHDLFALAGDRALDSGGAATAFEAYSLAGDADRLVALRGRLAHAPNLLRRLERRLQELTPSTASVNAKLQTFSRLREEMASQRAELAAAIRPAEDTVADLKRQLSVLTQQLDAAQQNVRDRENRVDAHDKKLRDMLMLSPTEALVVLRDYGIRAWALSPNLVLAEGEPGTGVLLSSMAGGELRIVHPWAGELKVGLFCGDHMGRYVVDWSALAALCEANGIKRVEMCDVPPSAPHRLLFELSRIEEFSLLPVEGDEDTPQAADDKS